MGKTICVVAVLLISLILLPQRSGAAYRFSDYRAAPPVHVLGGAHRFPVGLSPDVVKSIYHLPKTGGHGTVAIIGAYDDPTIESDLNIFSQEYSLPLCTAANGCFAKHAMGKNMKTNSGWATEASLDVEWTHAIAPQAKILLVEAKTASGANLINAIDYATKRPDVISISMSWGGAEFSDELPLDNHFTSKSGATFFASSGDDGAGASWPASSPRVIAVGGTSIAFSHDGKFIKETAWAGSGGGVSAYEPEPIWQVGYNIPRAKGKRAIPDVSYNADPRSGFAIVKSGKWLRVGGTSAGAPQWAAIAALGNGASNESFYKDKASENNALYFRDIISGANGDCGYYCNARRRYDYVTGLGSPLTVKF